MKRRPETRDEFMEAVDHYREVHKRENKESEFVFHKHIDLPIHLLLEQDVTLFSMTEGKPWMGIRELKDFPWEDSREAQLARLPGHTWTDIQGNLSTALDGLQKVTDVSTFHVAESLPTEVVAERPLRMGSDAQVNRLTLKQSTQTFVFLDTGATSRSSMSRREVERCELTLTPGNKTRVCGLFEQCRDCTSMTVYANVTFDEPNNLNLHNLTIKLAFGFLDDLPYKVINGRADILAHARWHKAHPLVQSENTLGETNPVSRHTDSRQSGALVERSPPNKPIRALLETVDAKNEGRATRHFTPGTDATGLRSTQRPREHLVNPEANLISSIETEVGDTRRNSAPPLAEGSPLARTLNTKKRVTFAVEDLCFACTTACVHAQCSGRHDESDTALNRQIRRPATDNCIRRGGTPSLDIPAGGGLVKNRLRTDTNKVTSPHTEALFHDELSSAAAKNRTGHHKRQAHGDAQLDPPTPNYDKRRDAAKGVTSSVMSVPPRRSTTAQYPCHRWDCLENPMVALLGPMSVQWAAD